MKKIFALIIILATQNLVAKDVVVTIQTSMGDIKAKLYHDKAPQTVSNFIELSRKGFYNGIIFHRIIDGFMIQTGDPKGNGTGGPGYSFADEFHADLKHSKPGILSMANSGKDTNGSQFFITVAPTTHLDQKHSVFGEVIAGMEIVEKIAKAPKSKDPAKRDHPAKEIKMLSIKDDAPWFKPVPVTKMQQLSDEDVRKASEKLAKSTAEKLGEVNGYGKLKNIKFHLASARNADAQVVYEAEFEKEKATQLILVGEVKGGKFTLARLQFGKADRP
jgi:cyclophilin family peptidyl-prolyl cis-trans isomerase